MMKPGRERGPARPQTPLKIIFDPCLDENPSLPASTSTSIAPTLRQYIYTLKIAAFGTCPTMAAPSHGQIHQ